MESDHNTILMEVNTEIAFEQKLIKRFRLNNKEGWKKYNEILKNKVREQNPKSQEELQTIMKTVMKQTVGEITIRTGKYKPKESNSIKILRDKKRAAKKGI